ncbi:unnamed protein product, partial [Heterosigma akashiwo]
PGGPASEDARGAGRGSSEEQLTEHCRSTAAHRGHAHGGPEPEVRPPAPGGQGDRGPAALLHEGGGP